MPKFSFNKILRRYLPLLIIVSVIYSLILCLLITIKTKPSDNEKFLLFMDANYGNVEVSKMENRIKELDANLKEVEVFAYSPSSNNYETYYSAKGSSADLLLLSKSYLENKKMDNFASLNSSYSTGYFVNDKLYGLLCKSSTSEYFKLNEDEEYYCFVRKDSTHISSISSSSYDNLSFIVMEEFFGVI